MLCPYHPSSMLTNQVTGETKWPRRVTTAAEAVKFIDAVGYCVLFPIKNLALPSLYFACARRDPAVYEDWDIHCQRIWKWKDELGRRKKAFYAKYFKGRGTFISLKLLPHFLALEESVVAPGDFERLYRAGRISHDARVLWEALAEHGPMATLELRHACKMETQARNKRFKKAILELCCALIVVHFGAEQETGAWASNRFELTCRAFPAQIRAARRIPVAEARRVIAGKYLEWHRGAGEQTLRRIFGWSKDETRTATGTKWKKD